VTCATFKSARESYCSVYSTVLFLLYSFTVVKRGKNRRESLPLRCALLVPTRARLVRASVKGCFDLLWFVGNRAIVGEVKERKERSIVVQGDERLAAVSEMELCESL
jgi:hypothetical protein